jgi:hypothetical protein
LVLEWIPSSVARIYQTIDTDTANNVLEGMVLAQYFTLEYSWLWNSLAYGGMQYAVWKKKKQGKKEETPLPPLKKSKDGSCSPKQNDIEAPSTPTIEQETAPRET